MRILKSKIWVYLFFVLFTLGSVLLTGCSKEERIEGKVEDIFGNALSDVTVKIEKSTFTATTDDSGLYSLDYAPSSMELTFSKDGYTTMSLSLDIKQKTHYPAETVTLYPIPKEEGMFYIDTDNKRLIKLEENGKIEKNAFRLPYGQRRLQYYVKNLKPSTTYIKSGKAMFIDRTPYPVKHTSFKENGLFYNNEPKFKNNYNGLIKDTDSKVGAEKLTVRTVKLTPGDYAWVQMSESIFDEGRAEEGGVAFGFKVEGGSTIKKTDSLAGSKKEQGEMGLDPKSVSRKDSINLNSNFSPKQKDRQQTQSHISTTNQLTDAERQELEQLRVEKTKAVREIQANSKPVSQRQISNSRTFQNTRVDTRTDGSEIYYARISQRDHYGKSGKKLKGAGTILQQDRANYHKYHKRDREDTGDNRFGTRDNRNKIKRMLARGSTSQKTLDAIRYGTPLVKVKIYNDSINVTLKSGASKTRQSKGKPSKCNTVGYIRGISRRGDGFVAVRKGAGTKYRMIDKIYHNGEKVKICDRKGKWKGIIYGDCISGSSKSHSGSCKGGWVYGQYIKLVGSVLKKSNNLTNSEKLSLLNQLLNAPNRDMLKYAKAGIRDFMKKGNHYDPIHKSHETFEHICTQTYPDQFKCKFGAHSDFGEDEAAIVVEYDAVRKNNKVKINKIYPVMMAD